MEMTMKILFKTNKYIVIKLKLIVEFNVLQYIIIYEI